MTRASDLAKTAEILDTSTFSFRNKIINGDMRIDQRNAGAAVTPAVSGTYTVDRWAFYGTVGSKLTYQRNAGSVTPPPGFNYYMGITSTSAYSITSSDAFRLYQPIEGLNAVDFMWGTSSAQPATLSFWVRSSLTGTFGGAIYNFDASRLIVFSYTINAANTWEYKSVVIPGDTTGTWKSDNTTGILLQFSLGAGSTLQGTPGVWGSSVYLAPTGQQNVTGTNGATFYITGVQFESGSIATSFERRPYQLELLLCQRYYEDFSVNTAGNNLTHVYATPKRTTPTVTRTASWISSSEVGTAVSVGEANQVFFYNAGTQTGGRFTAEIEL